MKCAKCKKKATITLKCTPPVCNTCFVKIIEHRVRKETRMKKVFKKHDKLLILDDGSKEARVSIYIMESIAKDMPIMVVEKKVKNTNADIKDYCKKNKINKIIIPWNADDEVELFVDSIFNKKKLKKDKRIKLLRNILDKEVETFANIKGLRYRKSKKKRTEIAKFLEDAEKRYPGTRFSLVKAMDSMSRL